MFNILSNLINKQNKTALSRDEAVELLKVNPELLKQFENKYKSLLDEPETENFFKVSAKQAVKDAGLKRESQIKEIEGNSVTGIIDSNLPSVVKADKLLDRITQELLQLSQGSEVINPVSQKDLSVFEENMKPQLTGTLIKKDISAPSYSALLFYFKTWLDTGDIQCYHRFRQGLDILDLDPVTYEIIGQNKNSIGYWFPTLKKSAEETGFFKVPETKIVKVPLPLLQLTRVEYSSLTPATIKILNDFCMKAFELDVNKKYFIKTGTYSSKFDFRNALVQGEKEVRELGEYLLFIHFQALQMASPLSKPCIYGVSTTNEWVVREFIEDVEGNPTIYKGMPLRTEYRFFVDFDIKEILGVSPYWREDVMIRSFNQNPEDPHKKHDYVIYKTHEEKLYKKYEENVEKLSEEVMKLISNMKLDGQWSLDIMQNGKDFYLIDMASAFDSALSDCVKPELLKRNKEDWIPKIGN